MDPYERAIAIVGLGAILPDADGVAAFWDNLVQQHSSIGDVPPDRWSAADYYDPDPAIPDKTYSKIGGWVRGFTFDWKRYRIPPRVAAAMDQSQQWAVTVAAQALADYGYPERPLDTERTAVVLGTAMGGELHYVTTQRVVFPEYAHALEHAGAFTRLPGETRSAILHDWHEAVAEAIPAISEDTMPGELPNVVSGRVANVLNLRGPNFITDAACASALAAVEAAIQLLVEGQADAVITGGIDHNMAAAHFVKFCKIGALSATGSRPFGDGADGFVMGEGAGAFLLKRLADAERDGDKIYAVVRGVGGSSDGKGKGITAPNPVGQQLALRRAWESAGLDPASASLIEAHGTSTRVGDVVEVESLNAVFGAAPRGSIGLGSVKSNLGHLKAAAGAAGLLKAALAMHHKVLPPTLNCRVPNPNIDFSRTPFELIHEAREWPRRGDVPRRCGVSAFGFGGTNFHLVLEEHEPGRLSRASGARRSASAPTAKPPGQAGTTPSAAATRAQSPAPVRGLLALGGADVPGLRQRLSAALERVQQGWVPPLDPPAAEDVRAPERLVIDFGEQAELLDRLQKADKALAQDAPAAWKALQSQGIARGRGAPAGKIAFLFPGQGSQYLNMGRALAQASPEVAEVIAQADQVMEPILGQPLSSYLFVDVQEPEAVKAAEKALTQTAITQPAMLTLDVALYGLLSAYGFRPDMVMGHSLGEYAALVVAGILPFAEALEAAAARGAEMTKVSVEDNGWMAAVMAPYADVETSLKEVDGYVVAANINSYNQCVIGGASAAVERAIQAFQAKGFQAQRLPVSHAFHTRIVAPASGPLRQVLNRLQVRPGRLPLVGNVTGEFYPPEVESIKDLLERQIASPVQWVKGLETMYAAGARIFVEVGPKKALKGLVDDVLGQKPDVLSLFTNHPKTGELASFNQALCGLYAAGLGVPAEEPPARPATVHLDQPAEVSAMPDTTQVKAIRSNGADGAHGPNAGQTGDLLAQALQQALSQITRGLGTPAAPERRVYDRHAPPAGSVVITGTGLGLPGAGKHVMDPENAQRILRGEQFVDLIPERFRKRMVAKRITRLVKGEDGSGAFAVITEPEDVIKVAGNPGAFDLTEEYGVPAKLVEALDITSQLAMAAGLDALREAGLPLVQTYRRTSTGRYLPDRWLLPEPLRDETGVIFASAFPGGDRFCNEMSRYYTWQNRVDQADALEDLRRYTSDPAALQEIDRRLSELREQMEREPYEFDRRFLFRVLSMGHSQFAEYIGVRGPNTQVNSACASTPLAIALGEDWIRTGRCRRVIVIAADDVTGDNMIEWVGAGFLAVGAAATDDRVDEAAVPFDRRRHGMLMGMGCCALVLESEDAVRERGMRGLVEVLSAEANNSAYHGSRLDVNHISQVMDALVTSAERRFGLQRLQMAPQLVFMSHETYTPARGGSASAEVAALRHTFGDSARDIVVANTKGLTGHAMGVGVEDVIAVKILEHGVVPPVPNFKEVDPELGVLNLSRGGRYPVQYGLHLSAGFGSQIAMTLTRRIPGGPDRIDQPLQYRRWLADVSGSDQAELEVVKHVLRIKAASSPGRPPVPSAWQEGTGPTLRARAPEHAFVAAEAPARLSMPAKAEAAPRPVSRPAQPVPEPAAVIPIKVETRAGPPAAAPPTPAPPPNGAAAKAETAAAPVAVPATPGVDPVGETILNLVAEKTGYPRDMLDLDLDLEADLGIDTVKQAETFVAIRSAFDIPRQENLKLRDYPTLKHVIGFVRQMRPDLAAPAAAPAAATVPEAKAPAEAPAPPQAAADVVAETILNLVAEKTGYPRDMLDLDLDLEADLGVDTVKQAETFMAIRGAFDIPRQENLKLRDYPTLRHVIGFVRQMRPELAEPASPAASAPATDESTAPQAAAAADTVAERVLQIIAEKTGYPRDMLDLDLDLEADLGIDTVKQAETFVAIRGAFDIPRQENLKLRDYPTLRHVINFVREMQPTAARPAPEAESGKTIGVSGEPGRRVEAPAASAHPAAPRPQPIPLSEADRFPRRVPAPALRPRLDLCKPTGARLEAGTRVIVGVDDGGAAQALLERLQARGVEALALDPALPTEALESQVKAWLEAGPIDGVYWLRALDAEPALETIDLPAWRELNRQRVKAVYTVVRALVTSGAQAPFLVTATHLDGLHGYGRGGAAAPLGGGVTGFAKAYKREQPAAVVKAVDFDSRLPEAVAEALIAETLADPGAVEVGHRGEERFSVTLVEAPLPAGEALQTLGPESVFVVTGAAGGITSLVVADLAAASGGTFYLLDLAPLPAPDDAHVRRFRSDKEGLKQQLIAEARAAGQRPTPAAIDKQILSLERQEAALRCVEAVQNAGGSACYYSLNLLDAQAVADVIAEIRQRHGRIDVLVHAAGLEVSRMLADKSPAEFDLVFDVKVDGFFNLLRASAGLPIGACLAFSSVAGRFGNGGQTDYSAANDLLCKVTSSLRAWRPQTRGLVIDWTAWSGQGMATRGSIPKLMELAGVETLAPEIGVPTVRRELTMAGPGEVVVAGKLGALVSEWDPTGGLDPQAAQHWLEQQPPRVMVGQLKATRLYGGWEVETVLIPSVQPFLYDHAMQGTPLLPGVMGTEAFAELAALAAPGYEVAAVEREQFALPFKFYHQQPQVVHLNLNVVPDGDGELRAHGVLRSVRQPPRPELPAQERVHFTADVRLARQPHEAPSLSVALPAVNELDIRKETIYQTYFHGPAYQVLERARVSAEGAVGLMADRLPHDTLPAGAARVVAPRLIELCFQTAGLWQMKVKGTFGLPQTVGSVRVYDRSRLAPGQRLFALVQPQDDGERYSAQVVDEAGRVYVELDGYQTVALPPDQL